MADNKPGGIAEKVILLSLMLSPLFIINWMHGTQFSSRMEYLLLFQSLTIIGIALSYNDKWIGLFGVWLVIDYFLLGVGLYGGAALFQIFTGIAFMILIKTKVNRHDLVLKAIGFSAIIVCISIIAQAMNLLPLTIGDFVIGMPVDIKGKVVENLAKTCNEYPGILGQSNITGAYLAICLPIFFIYYPRMISLVIACMFMTKCNGALIASGFGTVFYIIFKPDRNYKHIIIVILVCIVLAGGFCFVDKPNFEARYNTLKTVLTSMENWNILTGYGLGTFRLQLFKSNDGTYMREAHNEYLQIYYGAGLVTLAFILFYLGSLLNGFIKHFKQRTEFSVVLFSCLVIVIVVSVFSFNFHHPLTAMICLVVFVLVDKTLKGGSHGNDKEGRSSGQKDPQGNGQGRAVKERPCLFR